MRRRGACGESSLAPREAWERAFDLDGDGLNDTIDYDFSGGVHCCYRISVTLTATGATIHLPLELDGGYVGGLDLGQPHHYDVRRIDGPLPELVMGGYEGQGRSSKPNPAERASPSR